MTRPCVICGASRWPREGGYGRCGRCHIYRQRHGTDRPPDLKPPPGPCQGCGLLPTDLHYRGSNRGFTRGRCRACYMRLRRAAQRALGAA